MVTGSLLEESRKKSNRALRSLYLSLVTADDDKLDEVVSGEQTRRDHAMAAAQVLKERGLVTQVEYDTAKRLLGYY